MNAYIETIPSREPTRGDALFICCLVDSEWQAINIVDLFRTAGFSRTEVSVLFPNRSSHATASPADDQSLGIAPGVLAGALSWLAGFSALQMPPLGSFLAAGPISEELSDGHPRDLCDVTVPLKMFGIAANRAHYYAERLVDGEILIATHPSELFRANQAKRILSRWGAKDIDSSSRLGPMPEPEFAHAAVR